MDDLHMCGHMTFETEDVSMVGRIVYDRLKERFCLPHFTDIVTSWFGAENIKPLTDFISIGGTIQFSGDLALTIWLERCANIDCAAENRDFSLCECDSCQTKFFGSVGFDDTGDEMVFRVTFDDPEEAIRALAPIYATDTRVDLPEFIPVAPEPIKRYERIYLVEDPNYTGVVTNIEYGDADEVVSVLWDGMQSVQRYTPDRLRRLT